MKKYLLLALVVLTLLLAGLWKLYRHERAERLRFEGNQSALLGEVQRYRVRDSLNAIGVQALTLTLAEYKRFRAGDAALIREMGLSLGRLRSAAKTSLETSAEVSVPLRDTVIGATPAARGTPFRTFRWRDPWNEVRGLIRADTVDLSLRYRDTLLQAIHRVPRFRLLGVGFGTRGLRQEAVLSNPNAAIRAAEVVYFRKRTE